MEILSPTKLRRHDIECNWSLEKNNTDICMKNNLRKLSLDDGRLEQGYCSRT